MQKHSTVCKSKKHKYMCSQLLNLLQVATSVVASVGSACKKKARICTVLFDTNTARQGVELVDQHIRVI